MSAIAPALIRKLESLPQQRLAEVEDFVEFLAIREGRAAASARLGEALAKLDAANLPPLSDEDIAAEIAAARQERSAQAELVVSGDRHLLELGGDYQGIRIVSPAEAVGILES